MHRQLARTGAEQVAFHAHDVAQVEQLVELELAFGNGVLLHVDLQARSLLLEMGEAGLAHPAHRVQAPANAHVYAIRLQLLAGLGRVLFQHPRQRVCEIESVAVGLEAQRFDFADARQALFHHFLLE